MPFPRGPGVACSLAPADPGPWQVGGERGGGRLRLIITPHKPNTGIAELEYDVGSVSVKGALPTVDGRIQMDPCFSFP